MRTFIAGAISTRLSVASSAVEARSLAWPPASLAIRSAVAGATTTRSAERDSWIWPISASSVRLNRSWKTFSPDSDATESGVTNSRAGLGQDRAHGRAALFQPPDQLEGLVGRDAAADDEQHAFAAHADVPRRSAELYRNCGEIY